MTARRMLASAALALAMAHAAPAVANDGIGAVGAADLCAAAANA